MAWKKLLLEGDAIESPSGAAQGDILYFDGTNWTRLPAGTAGQLLSTQGANANPQWVDVSGTTDEKVKADANDTTAGYLSDKVDGATIIEDGTNHNIKVGTIKTANINIDADLSVNYHHLTQVLIQSETTLPNTGSEAAGQLVFNASDGHLYVYTA